MKEPHGGIARLKKRKEYSWELSDGAMLSCGEKRGKLDMYHLTVALVAILVAKLPLEIAKAN